MCICIQTHKHIWRLSIDDDKFSAPALHKLLCYVMVRVSECVVMCVCIGMFV